eukprot:CAMPEP_0197009942 /NCGR_PEP_ID=MMETSP1380-20130617/52147_1 /TAXON_ID=5936 /ORGANISM="Euplotes crassus, Strain CT5" /LENGTH=105 /DNA_ID=CAMNT_0042431535 /DNA_START=199 /DNA_END=513 /DNA_ORIENTATION=+
MSTDDFQLLLSYLKDTGKLVRLDEDRLFIMTKSLLKIGNKLYQWAEDKGVIDMDEISLLEDLYEMGKDDGLPSSFYKLPDAIKKETILSLAKRGKVFLYEGDEGY